MTMTRQTILNTLAAGLTERPWGAPCAVFFLAQADSTTVVLRPPLQISDEFWGRTGAPAEGFAEFVRTICNDRHARTRHPRDLAGLCFFSETVPAPGEPRPRSRLARAFAPRVARHIWATDKTGDIYDVSQTRGDSEVHRQVMAESDGWTGIGGTIPVALRQFAVAFLGAPSHLASP